MEIKWTNRLIKKLRDKGAKVIAIVGGDGQECGIPDRYIAHCGICAWVEFKGPITTVTAVQQKMIRELRAQGSVAVVCRFIDADHIVLEDHNGNILASGEAINLLEIILGQCSTELMH